jgi:hypothetical protein
MPSLSDVSVWYGVLGVQVEDHTDAIRSDETTATALGSFLTFLPFPGYICKQGSALL